MKQKSKQTGAVRLSHIITKKQVESIMLYVTFNLPESFRSKRAGAARFKHIIMQKAG